MHEIPERLTKTILDALLISAYIVGVISVMPVVIIFAWTREKLADQV